MTPVSPLLKDAVWRHLGKSPSVARSETQVAVALGAGASLVHACISELVSEGKVRRTPPPYRYWSYGPESPVPEVKPAPVAKAAPEAAAPAVELPGPAGKPTADDSQKPSAVVIWELLVQALPGSLSTPDVFKATGWTPRTVRVAFNLLVRKGCAVLVESQGKPRPNRYIADPDKPPHRFCMAVCRRPQPKTQAGATPVSQPAVEQNTGTATSGLLLSPRVADLPSLAPPVADSHHIGPAAAGSVADAPAKRPPTSLETAYARLAAQKPTEATFRLDDRGALAIVWGLDHLQLDPLNAIRLHRFLRHTGHLLDAIAAEAKG